MEEQHAVSSTQSVARCEQLPPYQTAARSEQLPLNQTPDSPGQLTNLEVLGPQVIGVACSRAPLQFELLAQHCAGLVDAPASEDL